jgi:hypothetical protein
MTIFKYVLDLDKCTIHIPAPALILSVGLQGDKIVVWVKVDPTEKEVERKFVIVGTGHPLPEDSRLEFVGTVQYLYGLVYHVFASMPYTDY